MSCRTLSLSLRILVAAMILVIGGCASPEVQRSLERSPRPLRGIVTLNFDDGYECVYRNAVPMLKRAGIPASFYIITSTYQQNHPDYMKVQQILDLAAHGNEIGVHTRTHPHLPTISPERAEVEIRGARDDLKDLGIHAKTFAYPYGEYDTQIVQKVREMGFSGARTTEPAFNDRSTNPFLLRRFEMQTGTTFEEVKGEIDAAMERRLWLILLFHKVEDSDERYNVSPVLFQQIVDYLVLVHAKTVTTIEGLRMTGMAR